MLAEFGILGLSVAERAVNHLFFDLSDDDKAPLVGKVLRLHTDTLGGAGCDVVFDVDKARFEPMFTNTPDCTVSSTSIKELFGFLTDPLSFAHVSISGDSTISDHVRTLITTHPKSQALIERLRWYV